jgi:glycogen synthase
MLNTIRRALAIYHKKTLRNKLRKAAMSCDYSWQSSAGRYLEIYRSMKPDSDADEILIQGDKSET